jgi:hypothetical protein
MPDERHAWDRINSESSARKPFSGGKPLSTYAAGEKGNPELESAIRERAIMIWTVAVVILLAIIAFMIYVLFLS